MITYRRIPTNFKTENNIGLGNQMFFMASTIGVATKLGLKYGFEQFYPEIFPNQAPEYVRFMPFHHIPWGYHDVTVRDGTVLYGYMQSEKYFKHCRDLILWHFEMLPQSNYILPDDAICVHIRGGDYLRISSHYRLKKDYYDKALSMFTGTPVVFTDDTNHAKTILPDAIYPEGNVFTHLWLMRQCKKFIIANSSLSWWAAWLAGGETIAPINWFDGPNKHMDTEDIYCENWIRL